MNINKRISDLRQKMKENNISVYLVPSSDFHQSEYVGEHFKCREFITGFSGSAGTAVITLEESGLWTDSRYHLQAEIRLRSTEVTLFKMGVEGVITVDKFIADKLPKGGVLGFDGRVVSLFEGKRLLEAVEKKNGKISYCMDLIGEIWNDRPPIAKNPVFMLPEKLTGESVFSKLSRVREFMLKNNAKSHILTTLDDIGWIFNIRGSDISYLPMTLCYAVIKPESADLYIDSEKLSDEILQALKENCVTIKPYNDIYTDARNMPLDEKILLDPQRLNFALYNDIPEEIKKLEIENPTVLWKATKNEVELKNIRNAHIKDGVAVTRFMRWIKMNAGKERMTERSVSDKLASFRAEQDGFISPSFSPICAYKEHAAMQHYSATPESDAEIFAEQLLLTDTGGNYFEGSTDITRTIVLGEISKEIKRHFTAVTRSMLNLSDAKFLYGVKGFNLDILARAPMWEMDIDYKHGTGHGVGYLLNIHEPAAGIRWQIEPQKHETHALEAGMVLTNEPGIYITGSHGIRLENEIVVSKGTKNEFGQFMFFETITFAPIDLDAIEPSLMSEKEKQLLNDYHELVYKKISPHLNAEEAEWLKEYTKKI